MWETHRRATGCHLSCGITQCYLPPDTGERSPPNPSHKAGTRFTYLRKDGRLSSRKWLVIPRWFTERLSPIQVLTVPDVE